MVFSELLPGTANGIGFTLTDARSRSDLLTAWAALILLRAPGHPPNTGLPAVEKGPVCSVARRRVDDHTIELNRPYARSPASSC